MTRPPHQNLSNRQHAGAVSLYEAAKTGYQNWFNALFDEEIGCYEGSAADCGWAAVGFIPFGKIGGWAGKAIKKIFGKGVKSADEASAAVGDLRSTGTVGRKRNIAAAEVNIKGNGSNTLLSASGEGIRAGTVPEVGSPGNPQQFISRVTGNNTRYYDSEFKLLNYIANQLGPSSKKIRGTINLHSERPPCISCSSVIAQFREAFPNIKINITTG